MRQLLKRGCLAPQAVNDDVGHLLSNCEPLLGPEGMAALSHKSIAITCHHLPPPGSLRPQMHQGLHLPQWHPTTRPN